MLSSRNPNKGLLLCLYRRRESVPLMKGPPARSPSPSARLPPWALSPAAQPPTRTTTTQWMTGQLETQSLCITSHGKQVCITSFPFFPLVFQDTRTRWNSPRSLSCSASSHPQSRVPPIKTTGRQKDTKRKVNCSWQKHHTHITTACSKHHFFLNSCSSLTDE